MLFPFLLSENILMEPAFQYILYNILKCRFEYIQTTELGDRIFIFMNGADLPFPESSAPSSK